MIKVELIFVIAIFLCMNITGCNKQDSGTAVESLTQQTLDDLTENSEKQTYEETVSDETVKYAEEYTIITAFYDSMVELDEKLTSRQFIVLSETITEVYDEFEAFDELANSSTDSIYSNYYSEMISNPFYEIFKSNYYEGGVTNTIDIDQNFISSTYADMVSLILKEMMYVKLPFDYDKQLTKDSTRDNNNNFISKKAIIKEMIMNAIDEGVDCTLDIEGEYAHTCDFYYVTSTLYWNISFEFHSIDEYFFSILITDSGNYNFNLTNIILDNGTQSIEFNSNYIDCLEYTGINCFYPFKSEFSNERNQKYEELKEMLNEDGDITIIANGTAIITLTPDQKQTLKNYTDMFDAIIMILKTN